MGQVVVPEEQGLKGQPDRPTWGRNLLAQEPTLDAFTSIRVPACPEIHR